MKDFDNTKDDLNIKIHFTDEKSLYKSYMSYVDGGAIFVRTKSAYSLGDKVTVNIKLLGDEPKSFVGHIIWITPIWAQHGLPTGIGIKLPKSADTLKEKIEKYISSFSSSVIKTDTL